MTWTYSVRYNLVPPEFILLRSLFAIATTLINQFHLSYIISETLLYIIALYRSSLWRETRMDFPLRMQSFGTVTMGHIISMPRIWYCRWNAFESVELEYARKQMITKSDWIVSRFGYTTTISGRLSICVSWHWYWQIQYDDIYYELYAFNK